MKKACTIPPFPRRDARLTALLHYCCMCILLMACGFPGGTAQASSCLTLSREPSQEVYTPGSTLDITLVLRSTCAQRVVSLGIQETLPQRWAYLSGQMVPYQGYTGPPPVQWPAPGAPGTLEFFWIVPPEFPFALRYKVLIPPAASGSALFSGQAIYFFATGGENRSARVETAVPPAGTPEGESPVEGEGEMTEEGEGETPAEGEGETPQEGETPAEGEGETPQEGETPAEGEGESTPPPKTRRILFCGGGNAPATGWLGDAVCTAIVLLFLFHCSRRHQGDG